MAQRTNELAAQSQSKFWVGTLNNTEFPPVFNPDKMVYLIFQKEKVAHEHYQFYVQLHRSQRFSFVKALFPGAHLEIQKGTNEQAKDYCNKPESRIDGPWEFGEFKPTGGQRGKRTDLHDVIDMVREKRPREDYMFNPAYVKHYKGIEHIRLLSEEDYHHPEVRGIWIYGPPGAGKSHYVRDTYKDLFIKSQNRWWDGYTGQKSVLMDDFDKQGSCLAHYLKIWADKWSCTAEYKGGTTKLQHHHFIITSNYTIDQIFVDCDQDLITAISRRFTVINIPERGTFIQINNLENNIILNNAPLRDNDPNFINNDNAIPLNEQINFT